MNTIRIPQLLLLTALSLAACTQQVKAPSGPPPPGVWQGGSAAPWTQTEPEKLMMEQAPVERPTPQPRVTY